MEAVILAGGKGTRIRPLTYTRAKPLLPMLNRPMLDWVLEAIPRRFDQVIVPLNYLPDQLRQHFEENPDPRVVLVDEPDPLGSAGALKNCERYFTGPFLVVNADIISSLDVDQLWDFHRERGAVATISLWPVDEPQHFGVVRLGPEGRITQFVEKPPPGKEPSRLINAGHYIVDPSLLDRVPKGRFMSLEAEIFTKLAEEEKRIFGLEFEGYWIDCGRPETYLEAHRVLSERNFVAPVYGEDVKGLDRSRLVSYAVGDRVSLGRGSVVERSVVFSDSVLGDRSALEDSILGSGVKVGEGARLQRCIVADKFQIPPGTHLSGARLGMQAEKDVENPPKAVIKG